MSYAIEVGRVTASIVDRRGQRFEAAVFLHTVSPHLFAAETVADRLNDPEIEFLPCEIEGRTELLRLAAICYVELAETAPEVERSDEVGAVHARVRLELCCGETLEGELIYEAPAFTDRVSDLLNDRPPRFVLLASNGRTLFVRRDAIDRVRL